MWRRSYRNRQTNIPVAETSPRSLEDVLRELSNTHPRLLVVRVTGDGTDRPPREISGVRQIILPPSSGLRVAEAVGLACAGHIVVMLCERDSLESRLADEVLGVAIPSAQNITLVELPAIFLRPGPNFPMTAIAGLDVFAPIDMTEVWQVLSYCVTRYRTKYVRIPDAAQDSLASTDAVPDSGFFSPGRWPASGQGDDIVMVSAGATTRNVLRAASELSREGASAAVLHAVSVRPVDRDALVLFARRSKRVLVCDDAGIGLAGTVIDVLASAAVPARVVGWPSAAGTTGPSPVESILRAARAMFAEKKPERRRLES